MLPPVELGNEQEKMLPPVVLGNEQLEFFRRMNKTYVNEEERYIKFEFNGTVFSEPKKWYVGGYKLRYFDKYHHLCDIFSEVQCNLNERPPDLIQSKVQLPVNVPRSTSPNAPASRVINESLGKDCAFAYNQYCYIGKICCSSGTFHSNEAVTKFFKEAKRGKNCFVDEKGTTFFTLSDSVECYTNDDRTVPKFI
ncbi:hypothetical protein NE237_014112 [Protea cynaroides]|uniref:Uncharacterized protein n=1 Tax=Protea cynaroides TaxID=273540 RepID=A0A9Q0H175_9MAGN|nr:hypothetical protein NE237_011495 [Protea cynaroides]KAJ4957329.1 hypothetical protein NE237_014112 [Protea cynaroides]